MKYWLLTTEYPPLSGGGISTYCWHTAQMLARQGHEVVVFIPNFTSKKRKKHDGNIKIVEFGIGREDYSAFLGAESALSFRFSEVLKDYAIKYGLPDFIESQEYNGIAYYPLQRKLLEPNYLPNVCFFITTHAPSFLYLEKNQGPTHGYPNFWIGEMEKSVMQSADFIISPSQYLIEQNQANFNWTNPNISVILNPYESESAISADFEQNDIVFFGKLTVQKGALQMLSYFKRIWDSGEQISLSIIGGGDHFFYPRKRNLGEYLKKEYKKYIDLGLLRFEGHINPDRIENRLKKAHIIIVPSIVDNLPYTVIEAMHLGKVVLASKDGGHKELIQNDINGFLFEHDPVGKNFIDQLSHILGLTHEDLLKIGSDARQHIENNCSYDVIYKIKIKLMVEMKNSLNKRTVFPFIRPIKRKALESIKPFEKNLLSIVIPYFNMGEFVEETLKSIVGSDYKNTEIILVNDGSTSTESNEVVQILKLKYDIKLVERDNKGLSTTRNEGALMARGEFLAFLDPDDSIETTYYSKAIQILKSYDNVSFVGCWAQYFGASNDGWAALNPEPPLLLVHNMVNSSAIITKRNDFLGGGMNDPAFVYGMEDYDSIIGMVKNGYHGVIIPEKLWNYRIRPNSMAQSFNVYSQTYLYKLISKKHRLFVENYSSDIFNIINTNGSGIYLDNPTQNLFIEKTGWKRHIPSKVIDFVKNSKLLRRIAKILVKY